LYADKGDFERVSLQLQWKHQFQFAGYYIAKEKGFYKDVGLKVEIKEFDFSIDTANEIKQNRATYGIGRSSLMIDEASVLDIVLLSAIFQSSPAVILATKSSNIKNINDFKNKRIMVTSDASNSVSIQAMINKQNINIDKMIKQKHSFNIDDLINNKTDLMLSYISNEPFVLEERGIEYTIFDPKDYGFDFYSDILFTSKNEINNHRQRAKNFNDASLKGWEYAFLNIEETVDIIFNKYNTQNKSKESLIFEAKKLKELAYYKTDKLGTIDIHKAQRIYDIYNVMGLTRNNIDINELIYKFDSTDDLQLTRDEEKYIKNNKIIRMCNNAVLAPIEFANNGDYDDMRGISIDILKLIENEFDIKFINIKTENWTQSQEYLKDKRCYILPSAIKSISTSKYANFTTPYLETKSAIFTKKDSAYYVSFDDVSDRSISLVKNSGVSEYLLTKYPKLKIMEVDSAQKAMKSVENGKVYFTTELSEVGIEILREYALDSIHIAGYVDNIYKIRIAVRNDDILLLNILNKYISTITDKQHKQIYTKWVKPLIKEKVIDHTLVWQIILVSILIILIILYWYLKTLKINKKLLETEKKLKLLASTDSMTKLYNRRFFLSTSEHTLELSKRNKSSTSVIILDIDDFKKVNDTYGHKVGDDVIVTLASLLTKYTRRSDMVCRWGGEEFTILLPETNLKGALNIAEKIRHETEKLYINTFSDKKLKFTVSIGVSLIDKQGDLTIENSIHRADEALYEAKHNGKNRVEYK